MFLIATFYKFVHLPDCRALRMPLLDCCRAAGVLGTILLAEEGINATIAAPRPAIERVMAFLRADPRFADLQPKESQHATLPFQRMKVRLKKEIAALKVAGVDPNAGTGIQVEPADWNALIAQDDVLLIDARNDYEVQIGSFPRALNPQTAAFNELPQVIDERLATQKQRRIAMFCTGGIRCEKATALMRQQGFEQVFQLKGGILRYLAEVDPADSLWQGECFVFDERVALDHRLQKGSTRICDDCKAVVSPSATGCPHCHSTRLLS